jgi:ADP-dependent NAD(P)H-hydrate dehydratase / NAD(P)H-hydrate epimerase
LTINTVVLKMKVVTAEQMRQIDKACSKAGTPTAVLMENAGRAVAQETRGISGPIERQHIIILAGPGNNGGDGLVAARYLYDWGATVTLYLFGKRTPDDSNLQEVKERGISCLSIGREADLDGFEENLLSATAVVDALFGTGNNRALTGVYRQALQLVGKVKENLPGLKIIALDLPSGLNADTGAIDSACLFADNTVTLAFPKVGLFCPPGLERVGKLTIADIGIPEYLADSINTEMLTPEWIKPVLPKRPLGANKGTFGKVLVIAGSINYIGAAYLACSGAIRAGAGLVTLATPVSILPILATKLTEATYLPLTEKVPGFISEDAEEIILKEIERYDVLLIGCGLGQQPSTVKFIKSVLLRGKVKISKAIIDADALNALSGVPDWWKVLPDNVILTPHPGEMARLVGVTVKEVQSDRLETARKAASEWHKTVVLKGAFTVIAAPNGKIMINPAANPGLASAGTGDVLSGVIAGLAAHGLNSESAAACGVYLHSQAGEIIKEKIGDTGMIASDLLSLLPVAIKNLKESTV